jgi:hypothetical protein
MNHNEGSGGSGRTSYSPDNQRGPATLPPALIPTKINPDKRVLDVVEAAPKSVRGALPLSPNARNIDSLERDVRMLLSGYRDAMHPMVLDATAHAASETRMILHFLYDAKPHMRDLKLAPFAQNKIGLINNAVKAVSHPPYEEAFLQHVQVARHVEEGLGQRGYNWAFQRHESGAGVVYSQDMLNVMHEIVRLRGFDLKADVDGLVKSLNDDYVAKGIRPSREQFIADFRAVVDAMGHYDAYGETERPSVSSIQSQKMKIQQFLQQLGMTNGIDADVPKWQEIIQTNVERIEDPAQYFHYESFSNVANRAANEPLNPVSVRYAVSAINRYLMQAYYAAFELKLIGKNV